MKRPRHAQGRTVRRFVPFDVTCRCGWSGEVHRLGAECPECDKPLYPERAK